MSNKTDQQIVDEFTPLIPKKVLKARLDRLKEPRAGSIFTPSEEIAQEWLLRSMLGESMKETEDIPKRLDEHRKYGGVAFRDWDNMKAENKALKRQLEWATGYTARTLMEHNVTGTFVQNYEKQYGENEWINIVYLKELFEIVARPHSPISSDSLSEKGSKQP